MISEQGTVEQGDPRRQGSHDKATEKPERVTILVERRWSAVPSGASPSLRQGCVSLFLSISLSFALCASTSCCLAWRDIHRREGSSELTSYSWFPIKDDRRRKGEREVTRERWKRRFIFDARNQRTTDENGPLSFNPSEIPLWNFIPDTSIERESLKSIDSFVRSSIVRLLTFGIYLSRGNIASMKCFSQNIFYSELFKHRIDE